MCDLCNEDKPEPTYKVSQQEEQELGRRGREGGREGGKGGREERKGGREGGEGRREEREEREGGRSTHTGVTIEGKNHIHSSF